jgi:hypothetical protein
VDLFDSVTITVYLGKAKMFMESVFKDNYFPYRKSVCGRFIFF